MKFFVKIYISMLILIAAAVAFSEYYIVALSLDSSLQSQIDASLKQHQLVKYAIQSDMLSITVSGSDVEADNVGNIARQTAEAMGVTLALFDEKGRDIYSNYEGSIGTITTEEKTIDYKIMKAGEKSLLLTESSFTQYGIELKLCTVTDITFIYTNARNMQNDSRWVFFVSIGIGAAFALVISFLITKPVKELTRAGEAFKKGDYSKRVKKRSHDEIGELADTFNGMADSIEKNIADLELAVKQREDFTAAFAHELKTPMTSIIGYADTLYQKNLPEDEAREAAGFIVNEGMRLEALSFKLLELMTMNNHDYMLEEIEMTDFFHDIKDTILPSAQKKGVKISFMCSPGYVKIEYDLFKTMILNLTDNALKSGTDKVAVVATEEDGEYVIAIVDEGRGIPAAELKRVTEAFYMVDKARSRKEHGAGLGLALCEKIAEIHGTRLDIRSREGMGTAIRIRMKLENGSEE